MVRSPSFEMLCQNGVGHRVGQTDQHVQYEMFVMGTVYGIPCFVLWTAKSSPSDKCTLVHRQL